VLQRAAELRLMYPAKVLGKGAWRAAELQMPVCLKVLQQAAELPLVYPTKVLGKGVQEAAGVLPKVLGAADQLKLPKEGAKEVVELLQSALHRRQFRQLKSHPRRLIDESKQM
jgi:hypothetical protein